MKVVFGISKAVKYPLPVVALGVFDGVHRAHRQILGATAAKAREIRGTSIAVTFYPHPQKKESLYSLTHRINLIAQLGIDVCIVIKFSKKFSRISAEEFIKNILYRKLGARYIYVGENFRFGKGAKGDFKILSEYAPVFNYKLKGFRIIKVDNKPVSSTYLRRLINRGKLAAAEYLLLDRVTILGTVVRGRTIARKLGFPTANINPHHEVLPPSGVYAVWVIYNNKRYKGLCNIGIRPTFLNRQETLAARRKKIKNIEVYLFGFRGNIYGKDLQIQFIRKLRNEKKFKSPFSLTRQILSDVEQARVAISPH